MNEESRPKWDYQLRIEAFRSLLSGVVQITHHWEMTSADTSRDWAELHTKGGYCYASSGAGDCVWELFQFRHDYKGLLKLTYKGERALALMEKIDAYDRKFDRELAEYKRLKAKFEGVESGDAG